MSKAYEKKKEKRKKWIIWYESPLLIPGFHFQLHREKSNSISSYETHKSSKLKSYILLIDTLRGILSYKLHGDTIPKSMIAIRYTFYRGGKQIIFFVP